LGIRRILAVLLVGLCATAPLARAAQEPAGSIRGVVTDRDFDAPLPLVAATIVELPERRVLTSELGDYTFTAVPPGRYTLIFAKDGYLRVVRADVLVAAGQLTESNAALAGDYTEMEEFVVRDLLQLGGSSEAALIELRLASPSVMDSIGADLMSQAGAGDAASALRLVAGATVKDGKSAVIRGLPDRYVSSQLNGVRLPTADEDKRAVELDQFPSSVIESIQVSKTFTPDQQGDASGGAVDVRLKSIPDEWGFEIKSQYSRNTQVKGRSPFLTYEGGGVNSLGKDHNRGVPEQRIGESWDGAIGPSYGDAPGESKWSMSGGGSRLFDNGLRIGGFASVFYERDVSFFDDGVDDSWWVEDVGAGMTPERNQVQGGDDFKTRLFDVQQGVQSVQLGGLAAFGVESERHRVGLSYLYSRTAEDVATIAEDMRGKEYYFPGHNPYDPFGANNSAQGQDKAPYLRLETLQYTERDTGSLQLHGEHTLPLREFELGEWFGFKEPVLEWAISRNESSLNQPDKRQFGSLWWGPRFVPGVPPFTSASWEPPRHLPYKPGANFTLGNLQRIWKEIQEDSQQYAFDLKLPFDQWEGLEGSVKAGIFSDRVERSFDQDTYSNFADPNNVFYGRWDALWSEAWEDEEHAITPSETDVDYTGDLHVEAWYLMTELPVHSALTMIAGARFESTAIGIVNSPEEDALWFPPGDSAPRRLAETPGIADVDIEEDDTLPAVSLIAAPLEHLTVRAAWSQTIARQTFKEITPILQQEYLGGPVFIGNPELRTSDLDNYDLRADFTPASDSLISVSWFRKKIADPIEYVQNVIGFSYTTAVNYPSGDLDGWEFELRQGLGRFWRPLDGLALGANATIINSEVRLTADEILAFEDLEVPIRVRAMTNAPEHLYNVYLTYDLAATGTQFGLFWTFQGDTLVAGAGVAADNFVPSLYATSNDSLNFSVSQQLGKYFKLQFQAKNISDPLISTVYRSEYIGDDVVHTSFKRGVEYSLSLTAEISF
jgi:TonB-dependent receptor